MAEKPQPVLAERGSPWLDWSISVLNGVLGDYLHARQNGLAIGMACYHQNRPLPLTAEHLRAAHPQLSGKLCVLVHGLGCHEGIWAFHDTADHRTRSSYGTLLRQDLGYTPFYVRYNTGLPVAENGMHLAVLLADLLACYPMNVDHLVLIGHSMGGLVLRGACHRGTQHRFSWVERVKDVFYLGTPHEGADLERLGHVTTVALRSLPNPITRLVGTILDLRSRGVKDLRTGGPLSATADESVLWLEHARHHLIHGALTANPDHLGGRLLGDTLVKAPRAPGAPNVKTTLIPGMSHMGLAHDAEVYRHIKLGCADN